MKLTPELIDVMMRVPDTKKQKKKAAAAAGDAPKAE
jgi:hypothetical protein